MIEQLKIALGLRLVVRPLDDGHSYEWVTKRGRCICSGWMCGNASEARREALRQLAEDSMVST